MKHIFFAACVVSVFCTFSNIACANASGTHSLCEKITSALQSQPNLQAYQAAHEACQSLPADPVSASSLIYDAIISNLNDSLIQIKNDQRSTKQLKEIYVEARSNYWESVNAELTANDAKLGF